MSSEEFHNSEPIRRKEPRRTDRRVYLSFGDAPRLVSLSYISDQLEPLGLTPHSTELLLHRLRVPIIHFGTTKLVDLTSFQLALCAISRIGEPDFSTPETPSMGRCKVPKSRLRTELDLDEFKEDWTQIFQHFICGKTALGAYKPKALQEAALAAAERLLSLGFHNRLAEQTVALTQESFKEASKTFPTINAPTNPQSLP